MSIVTISRGSYSKGKLVAEKVAQCLGYECISRDVLLEASEEFNVPEIKLIRAIHDAPTILSRFSHKKEQYIAFIETALLKHLKQNNIVYHGLAGHFFVKEALNAVKVRIIADMETRVQNEMERENISADEALRILKKDDEERREWSRYLYGIDTHDPSLYDLVIHIHKITIDHAVDLICNTVTLEEFQTTTDAQNKMDDLILAAEIKTRLLDAGYVAQVSVDAGVAHIRLAAHLAYEQMVTAEIEKHLKDFDAIKKICVTTTTEMPITE